MMIHYNKNVNRILSGMLIVIAFLLSSDLHGQSISPTGNVTINQVIAYNVVDDIIYSSFYWIADLGTVSNSYRSGTTYYATVTWTTIGSSNLTFYGNGIPIATTTIYVNCKTPPSLPNPTFSADANTCAPRLLSYTGTPPSGVTWYWQTSATGTDMSFSGPTYSIYNSQTSYVRARNNSSGCWSIDAASYYATATPPPTYPANPTVSTNTCGAKTLTRGTPPTDVTWYWQGNTSMGTSTSNSATTFNAPSSGYYYIRARHNVSGCWSTSDTFVNVTINDPLVPNSPTTTSNACGNQTLSKSGSPPANVSWYWQGTNSSGTDYTSANAIGATFQATASGTYYLRARNTLGCWSPTSSSVVVTVNTIPVAPAVPSVATNTCDAKLLTRTNPSDGSIWYWQGTVSGGTSQANSATTYSASISGTNLYYLRALKNGCWSSQTQVSVTVTPTPAQASMPVADLNTCGSKVISKPTAPTGVSFFWQGTNANATDNTSPTATGATFLADATNTYYIRAKADAANCWSTASTAISVAINPVTITASTYDQYNPTIYATSSIKLMPGFVVAAGKPLTAKIVISPECNNFVNWTEQTVFDAAGSPVSISRTYSDGFGNPLESQTKDFLNNKVFGSQSMFNSYGVPVASSLAAPIQETDFIYKNNLVSNVSGSPYGANDFDLRTGSPGSVTNPNPVGTQPGTVGWYYSSSNTMETLTPTTQFPYSRSYTLEGPDPTVTQSAGPGDQHRMGSGHEVKSERQLITAGELSHYFSLRNHFVTTPPSFGTNLLSAISTNTTTGFTNTSGTTISSSSGYVIVNCTTTSGNPGISQIGGLINVTAGKRYVFSVKGYRSGTSSVNLRIRTGTAGANIEWPGAAILQGVSTENWYSTAFQVPAGVTQITVGILWNPAQNSTNFRISGVELRAESPDLAGYKYISTDPNGKRTVSFVDADGRSLASATITSAGGPPYTYNNWSYTYYNDAGQVVASVAPNGVNTLSSALPSFVTYFKYDNLGRLIETTSPDEGTSRFVYALDGRIRFSENQEQRNASTKRFSYTNYDNLGRLIESGEYSSTTGGYVFEPHTTTTPSALSVLKTEILESNFTVPIDQVASSNYTGVSRKLDEVRCTDYSFITFDRPGTGSPATQYNLYGQVSKTENENATTWYSYDEFGQLEWMKQNITGLGVKTVDYTYDYFGNVTQVAYQAGQADKFYHHYVYDLNQRLTEVFTSLDGTNKTLHAKYIYYLHGPLKRVELASNLQGIDYVYTINGALKSINHSDVAKDPGNDGSNGFSTDVFGQLVDYYDNDYSGAGYSAGSVTATGLTNQFNGVIRDISWFTPVDNPSTKKIYGYTYDNLYQLQNAQFGSLAGTAGSYTATLSATSYNENVPAYDKNGNIQSLIRKNKSGTNLGNYAYNYVANTNKVNTITNGGAAMMGYTYNTIGQMTQQTEGTTTLKVSYNAYGLTKEVRNASNQLLVSYAYDDRGDRVKKLTYNAGTLVRTTYYVQDAAGNTLAIYEQPNGSAVALTEVPIYGAGRLGLYKPVALSTFYEINDHLGNVRAVIGPPKTDTYTATMETETAVAEDGLFNNTIAPRVVSTAANNTPGGNEAVRINNGQPNGGYPGRITGPGIKLKVAPGDMITAEVWGYYEGGSGYSSTLATSTIAAAVATLFGGVSGAVGDPGKTYSAFNQVYTGGGFTGASGSSNDNIPAAYLNMVMFNNDLLANPAELPMAAIPITAAAFTKQKLTIGPINIPAPGYVYIYVNDNSNSNNWVHFDDLKITHVRSPFVSGSDYYPFGLTMSDREILTEPYRFGYQGQFAEEDTETGWNAFDLRMYDARFGRWLSPDPYGQFASPYVGMGNNPTSGTDPDGGLCCGGRLVAKSAGRAHTKILKGVTVTASRATGNAAATGILNGLATTAMNRSMGGFNINNSTILNGGAAVEGVEQGHDVAPRERGDGFQIRWEQAKVNSVRERVEARLANYGPSNPWIDVASSGIGALEIGITVTLGEIANKPFWKGAVASTKMFGKHLGIAGTLITGWQVYDDLINDKFDAHTVANVVVSGGATIAGGTLMAAGSTGIAAGIVVGSFVYGVASASGFDDKIDEFWAEHGRPLKEKLIKRIHGLK